jgi:biotin carboxyl carrier protein
MKRTLILGKESHELEWVHQDGAATLTWNGEAHAVDVLEVEPGCFSIIIGGQTVDVRLDAGRNPDPDIHPYRATLFDGAYEFGLQDPMKALLAAQGGALGAGGTLSSPMPGKIVKVLVAEGQPVSEGQTLLIMEAMKMQNELRSSIEGTVEKIHVAEGATVETGANLISIKAEK